MSLLNVDMHDDIKISGKDYNVVANKLFNLCKLTPHSQVHNPLLNTPLTLLALAGSTRLPPSTFHIFQKRHGF